MKKIVKSSFGVFMMLAVAVSCAQTNVEKSKDCIAIDKEELYSTILDQNGTKVCITGEVTVDSHGVMFFTRHSGKKLPYGGNIYLPISQEEAFAMGLKTGDIFSYSGFIEVKQLPSKCEKEECYIYYVRKSPVKK